MAALRNGLKNICTDTKPNLFCSKNYSISIFKEVKRKSHGGDYVSSTMPYDCCEMNYTISLCCLQDGCLKKNDLCVETNNNNQETVKLHAQNEGYILLTVKHAAIKLEELVNFPKAAKGEHLKSQHLIDKLKNAQSYLENHLKHLASFPKTETLPISNSGHSDNCTILNDVTQKNKKLSKNGCSSQGLIRNRDYFRIRKKTKNVFHINGKSKRNGRTAFKIGVEASNLVSIIKRISCRHEQRRSYHNIMRNRLNIIPPMEKARIDIYKKKEKCTGIECMKMNTPVISGNKLSSDNRTTKSKKENVFGTTEIDYLFKSVNHSQSEMLLNDIFNSLTKPYEEPFSTNQNHSPSVSPYFIGNNLHKKHNSNTNLLTSASTYNTQMAIKPFKADFKEYSTANLNKSEEKHSQNNNILHTMVMNGFENTAVKALSNKLQQKILKLTNDQKSTNFYNTGLKGLMFKDYLDQGIKGFVPVKKVDNHRKQIRVIPEYDSFFQNRENEFHKLKKTVNVKTTKEKTKLSDQLQFMTDKNTSNSLNTPSTEKVKAIVSQDDTCTEINDHIRHLKDPTADFVASLDNVFIPFVNKENECAEPRESKNAMSFGGMQSTNEGYMKKNDSKCDVSTSDIVKNNMKATTAMVKHNTDSSLNVIKKEIGSNDVQNTVNHHDSQFKGKLNEFFTYLKCNHSCIGDEKKGKDGEESDIKLDKQKPLKNQQNELDNSSNKANEVMLQTDVLSIIDEFRSKHEVVKNEFEKTESTELLKDDTTDAAKVNHKADNMWSKLPNELGQSKKLISLIKQNVAYPTKIKSEKKESVEFINSYHLAEPINSYHLAEPIKTKLNNFGHEKVKVTKEQLFNSVGNFKTTLNENKKLQTFNNVQKYYNKKNDPIHKTMMNDSNPRKLKINKKIELKNNILSTTPKYILMRSNKNGLRAESTLLNKFKLNNALDESSKRIELIGNRKKKTVEYQTESKTDWFQKKSQIPSFEKSKTKNKASIVNNENDVQPVFKWSGKYSNAGQMSNETVFTNMFQKINSLNKNEDVQAVLNKLEELKSESAESHQLNTELNSENQLVPSFKEHDEMLHESKRENIITMKTQMIPQSNTNVLYKQFNKINIGTGNHGDLKHYLENKKKMNELKVSIENYKRIQNATKYNVAENEKDRMHYDFSIKLTQIEGDKFKESANKIKMSKISNNVATEQFGIRKPDSKAQEKLFKKFHNRVKEANHRIYQRSIEEISEPNQNNKIIHPVHSGWNSDTVNTILQENIKIKLSNGLLHRINSKSISNNYQTESIKRETPDSLGKYYSTVKQSKFGHTKNTSGDKPRMTNFKSVSNSNMSQSESFITGSIFREKPKQVSNSLRRNKSSYSVSTLKHKMPLNKVESEHSVFSSQNVKNSTTMTLLEFFSAIKNRALKFFTSIKENNKILSSGIAAENHEDGYSGKLVHDHSDKSHEFLKGNEEKAQANVKSEKPSLQHNTSTKVQEENHYTKDDYDATKAVRKQNMTPNVLQSSKFHMSAGDSLKVEETKNDTHKYFNSYSGFQRQRVTANENPRRLTQDNKQFNRLYPMAETNRSDIKSSMHSENAFDYFLKKQTTFKNVNDKHTEYVSQNARNNIDDNEINPKNDKVLSKGAYRFYNEYTMKSKSLFEENFYRPQVDHPKRYNGPLKTVNSEDNNTYYKNTKSQNRYADIKNGKDNNLNGLTFKESKTSQMLPSTGSAAQPNDMENMTLAKKLLRLNNTSGVQSWNAQKMRY